MLSQASCSVGHECTAHRKLRRVKQRRGEAWAGEAAAVAMGGAAAVAMGEAASTEAQQRHQRKWEASAEGQVVADVVVFSSEEEEEEMEEEGQEEEEMSEVTEEDLVAEAQWQWLHGSARSRKRRRRNSRRVWVELRWCAKKKEKWYTQKVKH